MTVEKINKRITLFPKDSKPLTQEGLMNYINPMGEIGFLPKVNKGVFLEITDEGTSSFKEAWTVEFFQTDESLKVSVTVDRVDIISDRIADWEEFLERTKKIIDIVLKNSPTGIVRIALGSSKFAAVSEDEMKASLRLTENDIIGPHVQEKSNRTVNVAPFETGVSDQVLNYNNVHTITYTRESTDWKLIDDYDVNTVVNSDIELVTQSIIPFLTKGITELKEYGKV